MKPKNKNITISELGEENTFVSGNKNWQLEWAELDDNRFEVGTKVRVYDEDDNKYYKGFIDWLIIIDDGSVQISIAKIAYGRVSLEDLEIIK